MAKRKSSSPNRSKAHEECRVQEWRDQEWSRRIATEVQHSDQFVPRPSQFHALRATRELLTSLQTGANGISSSTDWNGERVSLERFHGENTDFFTFMKKLWIDRFFNPNGPKIGTMVAGILATGQRRPNVATLADELIQRLKCSKLVRYETAGLERLLQDVVEHLSTYLLESDAEVGVRRGGPKHEYSEQRRSYGLKYKNEKNTWPSLIDGYKKMCPDDTYATAETLRLACRPKAGKTDKNTS